MKHKIRLLIIVPRYGTISRGVESFASDLIERLDKNLFEICVLSDLGRKTDNNVHYVKSWMIKREVFGFIDRINPFLRKFLGLINLGNASELEALTLFFFYPKILKKARFDIAIPLGGYWTYLMATKLSYRVLSIGQSGPVKRWLTLSDFFVALTPEDKKNANKMNPSIPTAMIPNGVDATKFNLQNNKGNKRKRIICVAAFVEDKRHKYLFDAMEYLTEDIELICVGRGILEDNLKKHNLVKKGQIKFTSVDYKDIPAIYEEADVFTLPSLDEAFGIVFIEALCAGLPVVAHDGPRQRFVIGDSGLYCNTSNPKEYADALKMALKRNKSQEVRDNAIKKYDWRQIVDSYTKVLIELSRS